MKSKKLLLVIGILICALVFVAVSVKPVAAGYWCRFDSLKPKPSYYYERFITFYAYPSMDITQATLEINGVGEYEVNGLSCVRGADGHVCTGFLLGLPLDGETALYSGRLTLNNEGMACTASKIAIP
jgi:hypothetical protein